MKEYLFIILVCFLSSCLEKSQKTQSRDNKEEIELENEFLRVSFNKKTGELSSIINKVTKDNYIKKPGDGNIFRLYADSDSMPALVAGAHDCANGGKVIEPFGGVYGQSVSMQWQCVYEPELKEGLAFIAMDTLFMNKILTCFPEGGMTSLYFDEKKIENEAVQNWPSARIIVYNGNWRKAALEYRNSKAGGNVQQL